MWVFLPPFTNEKSSGRLQRVRVLTFIHYNKGLNWKAISTNIKTTEWFGMAS